MMTIFREAVDFFLRSWKWGPVGEISCAIFGFVGKQVVEYPFMSSSVVLHLDAFEKASGEWDPFCGNVRGQRTSPYSPRPHSHASTIQQHTIAGPYNESLACMDSAQNRLQINSAEGL